VLVVLVLMLVLLQAHYAPSGWGYLL